MAKLNKGQAMEAMMNRLATDPDVVNANGAELRLMDDEQFRASARRVIALKHGDFLSNVFPKYVAEVTEFGYLSIIKIWCAAIHKFEDSDPVINAENKLRHFRMSMEWTKNDALATLARFNKRMQENPLDAFAWGEKAVEAAGQLSIIGRVESALSSGMSLDAIQKDLTRIALEGLRISGSTSQMSNLANTAEAMAAAKMTGLR